MALPVINTPKLSYARGVGECLQRNNLTSFSTPDMLKTAADHASDLIHVDGHGNIDPNSVMKAASFMIELSTRLINEGKTASVNAGVSLCASETSAYDDLLYKVACNVTREKIASDMGPLANGGQHLVNNTIGSPVDPAAAQENMHRPPGYAHLPQMGAGNFSEPQAARVGVEMPHPGAADMSPANGAAEASKAAHYQQVAAFVVPRLPSIMPMQEKVAAVQQAAQMDPSHIPTYLNNIHAHYSQQTAGAVLGAFNR
ncbi:MAG: hypothetical protein E6R03_07615 [Hyphomicrobiaceae bacterium]|nr:MAG: hypothetical protein E6R03_07615 [Hyphomicrobiaceae bacterium]